MMTKLLKLEAHGSHDLTTGTRPLSPQIWPIWDGGIVKRITPRDEERANQAALIAAHNAAQGTKDAGWAAAAAPPSSRATVHYREADADLER